jgi:hypothetical protein
MTISAQNGAADADRLTRSLELYRDLTVALRGQITTLSEGGPVPADCKDPLDVIKAHQRAIQTIIDIEERLAKSQRAWAEGAGGELDLDAARAEIAARLSRWVASG